MTNVQIHAEVRVVSFDRLLAAVTVPIRWSCGAGYPTAESATARIEASGRIHKVLYSIPVVDLTLEFQDEAIRRLYGWELRQGSTITLIWGDRPFVRISQDEAKD